MIDTLKCETDALGEEVLAAIRRKSGRTVHFVAGDLMEWSITSDQLDGSYDHRLGCRLSEVREGFNGKVVGEKLSFEGSVHKHLMGHNCYGGPTDVRACGRYVVHRLEEHFGVALPSADDWKVQRVDVAECDDLGSLEAVLELLDGQKAALINLTTKRKVATYETGWCTTRGKGAETRLKAYAKGPDFDVHDLKRMWKSNPDQGLADKMMPKIQERANNLIRYEVEIYRPGIMKLTESGRLGEIDSDAIHRVAENILSRFMRENRGNMEKVRTSRAVEARLLDVYGQRLGSLLYGLWFRLAANGEEAVRGNMARRSYYRQRAQLLEAGCHWANTDVHVLQVKSRIPEGYFIGSGSPWRISGENAEVTRALAAFAA